MYLQENFMKTKMKNENLNDFFENKNFNLIILKIA